VPAEIVEMTGERFGRLVVVEFDSLRRYAYWKCRCDCGATRIARGSHLRLGIIQSCGCLRREHGARVGRRAGKLHNFATRKNTRVGSRVVKSEECN
jgi:hypothetical protein